MKTYEIYILISSDIILLLSINLIKNLLTAY